MKVGYILVGEDLGSELLRRQVMELLGEIKNQDPQIEISVLNFQSIPSILNNMKKLMRLSAELRSIGIRHCVLPNLCPWPIPNLKFKKISVGWRPYSVWNRHAARAFAIWAMPFFYVFNKLLNFNVFHCRSYPPALAAIKYKQLISGVKIIFDPRSDFPEENVTAGNWIEDDKNYEFWKSAEANLLSKSDSTALIGPTYLKHYRGVVDGFNYFIVPNNVATEVFKNNAEARRQIRKKLGIGDDVFLFVYSGALTEDGWHRIAFYKEFYDAVVKGQDRMALLIITPDIYSAKVQEAFNHLINVYVVSPEYTEVAHFLSSADAGLMFLHRRKIAVGTKVGEYLCTDIPVVINDNCVGAVDLINQNPSYGIRIGLSLGDLDSDRDIDKQKIKDLINYRPKSVASAYFSISSIASSYREQYENCYKN